MNEFFLNNMKTILKDEYDDFIEALNKDEVKGFYLNTNKVKDASFLDQDYITRHPVVKEGYLFDYKNYPLGKMSYFLNGLYYIQEPSAMLVSYLLDVKEDDYVLDMCAAPGGKSCYIGMKLSNEGLLVSNDIDTKRAKILSGNIERFGLKNTIVTSVAPERFEKILPEFFDKIVLDAPCSGEGMFRKDNPAIETYSINKVKECSFIQKQLIDTAMKLLKPGGTLIYSTCTYNTIENEENIQYLLDHYDVSLIPIDIKEGMSHGINIKEAIRLYPHRFNGEGHFICKIRKNGTEKDYKYKGLKPRITSTNKKLVDDFYKQYLNIPSPDLLIESNNHIYAISDHFPDLEGIQILRNGLYLGECKKNRFEPSFSLAMSLKKEDAKQSYSYNYNSKEILDYMSGLTLKGSTQKGYGLLCIDDHPFSFYKESDGIVKNLFPKGLRR